MIFNFHKFLNENISSTDFIRNHIINTNPHSGARDAFQGIGKISEYNWNTTPVLIYPDDKKINIDDLYPASKLDVKRYKKAYLKGSDFPAIVLIDNGEYYSIWDGAHRLKAAIELNVPIKAYIGYKI
jgi:hypothetical protein